MSQEGSTYEGDFKSDEKCGQGRKTLSTVDNLFYIRKDNLE